METADVVVIGAGVIGASVAWHLAARGCRDVLVLEREARPGLGSTGKATGGYRAQFNSEANVRLSLLAREKLLRFADEVGGDPGYRPCGYLFLAGTAGGLDALLALQAVQKRAGLHEARAVTPEEAGALNPAVRTDGVVGGVYCPTDGFIRPLQILEGYAAAARRMGVRFAYDSPVTGFHMEEDRIAAVRTGRGEVAAGAVVNAAGAWAGRVAAWAGAEIPVVPLRRQVAATVPCTAIPECAPMTVFLGDGFHFRVRDGRVLLLLPDTPRTSDPFDHAFDERWLPEVTRRAHARVPALAGVPIDRAACWAGLYEMSPDHTVLLGRAPGVENLYLANGSSGHGVMHSPALGQLLTELILDGRATTMDVHDLRPSRFAEGAPLTGPAFL
jgi:glycine/D-amino acid oxidase-like deaminating enzyme